MPALDVLVVENFLAVFHEPGRHLAGMAGVDAIVAGRRRDQERRVGTATVDVVIWREAPDRFPFLGRVGVAVFPHPARAGQQRVIPTHVEQRHLADDRTEEVGPQRVHVADEQAAVAAPLHAKVLGRRDLAGDQILGHRNKILVGPRPLLLERGLMPRGAEFTAAADISNHVDVFLLEPGHAGHRVIARQQGNLETAVAVEERRRRAVERQVFRGDLKVGHPRAILRHGLVLAHRQPRGVKERRSLLEPLGNRPADRAQRERRRLEGTGRNEKEVVALEVVDGQGVAGADFRHARQRLPLPAAVTKGEREQPVSHVVERGDDHVVFRAGETHQRRAGGGLEEHVQRAVAHEKLFEVGGEQAAGLIFRSAGFPVASQLNEQPLAMDRRIRIVGLFDLDEPAVAPQEKVARVKGFLPHDKIPLKPGREVPIARHTHVLGLTLEDERRCRERRAPLPFADRPRVARGRQRTRSEVRGHEEAVFISPGHAALRLRQREPIRDERLPLKVKLADHIGIGPAPRKRHEADLIRGLEHHRPMPDPVFLLVGRQRVEIDDRLPGWIRLLVFSERRAAPEALRVRRIPPEVVEPFADLRDHRDPLLRVEDREDPGFEAAKLLRFGQRLHALGIPFPGPRKRLFACHVLQPQMGIGEGFAHFSSMRLRVHGQDAPEETQSAQKVSRGRRTRHRAPRTSGAGVAGKRRHGCRSAARSE